MREAKELSHIFPLIFNLIGKSFKSMMSKTCQEVTHGEMRILIILKDAEREKLLMSELALELGVTKGTLTTTIKSVIDKKYCKKEKSKVDARKSYISLAPKGKALLAKKYEYLEASFESLLKKLSKSDRKDLLKAYREIFQILTKLKG